MALSPEGPFERLEAAVDTGAFYCWVPRSVLERLGVKPHASETFVLASGDEIDCEIGRAWVRHNGQMEITIVVFGKDGTETLLGAYALEGLRLMVDPVNEQLVPIPRFRMLRS